MSQGQRVRDTEHGLHCMKAKTLCMEAISHYMETSPLASLRAATLTPDCIEAISMPRDTRHERAGPYSYLGP